MEQVVPGKAVLIRQHHKAVIPVRRVHRHEHCLLRRQQDHNLSSDWEDRDPDIVHHQ